MNQNTIKSVRHIIQICLSISSAVLSLWNQAQFSYTMFGQEYMKERKKRVTGGRGEKELHFPPIPDPNKETSSPPFPFLPAIPYTNKQTSSLAFPFPSFSFSPFSPIQTKWRNLYINQEHRNNAGLTTLVALLYPDQCKTADPNPRWSFYNLGRLSPYPDGFLCPFPFLFNLVLKV